MTPREEKINKAVPIEVPKDAYDQRIEELRKASNQDLRAEAQPSNHSVIMCIGDKCTEMGADEALKFARKLNKVAREAQNLSW